MGKGTALKQVIAEKNTTLEAVACILGINRTTLYRKMKGGLSSLTLLEAEKISKYLNLTENESRDLFGWY